MRARAIVLATFLLSASVTGPAASAFFQPDVETGPGFGAGVYSPTEQTRRVKIKVGRSRTFHFWAVNAGDTTDSFSYLVCPASSRFRTTFFDFSGNNITSQLRAFAYVGQSLEPGWSEVAPTMKVKVRRSARPNDRFYCGVQAISVGDSSTDDTVGYLIKAV